MDWTQGERDPLSFTCRSLSGLRVRSAVWNQATGFLLLFYQIWKKLKCRKGTVYLLNERGALAGPSFISQELAIIRNKEWR
jgi:hypothetical protein